MSPFITQLVVNTVRVLFPWARYEGARHINTMKKPSEEHITSFQLIILVLSVYVIIALSIDIFIPVNKEVSRLIQLIDNILCVVFMLDFIISFIKAKSKMDYMKTGWLDLISAIPTIGYFRYARIAKIIRIFRVIKTFRTLKGAVTYIYKNKIEASFASMSIIMILIIIMSSILILYVEDVPNGNIKKAEDALWWTITTATTVGYGDFYPVTRPGRIIAVILMITGIGMFSSLTALISTFFVKDSVKNTDTQK